MNTAPGPQSYKNIFFAQIMMILAQFWPKMFRTFAKIEIHYNKKSFTSLGSGACAIKHTWIPQKASVLVQASLSDRRYKRHYLRTKYVRFP